MILTLVLSPPAQIAGFIDSFMYNSLHVRRGAAALTSKFG